MDSSEVRYLEAPSKLVTQLLEIAKVVREGKYATWRGLDMGCFVSCALGEYERSKGMFSGTCKLWPQRGGDPAVYLSLFSCGIRPDRTEVASRIEAFVRALNDGFTPDEILYGKVLRQYGVIY